MAEMEKKYADMYHTFKPEPAGPGYLPEKLVFRGDKDIPGARMTAGFLVVTEPHVEIPEPIYHNDADTYLPIFGGKLPDVFDSWDAEVHLYMGPSLDKMEKVVITEPTMVKIPFGWWHGPMEFVRVDKPIFYQPMVLGSNADYTKMVDIDGKPRKMTFSIEDEDAKNFKSVPWTVINEDGVKSYTDKGAYDPLKTPTGEECILMDGKKSKPYSNAAALKAPKPELTEETAAQILAMPREITYWGEWCPCPQTYYRGRIYHEAATFDIGFQLYCKAVDAEVPHFHSSGEEYLFFMGADPSNPMDFDCEIELPMGDGPEGMASKIITSPTVVRLPPNTWHAPIKFRKMNKPVLFQAAYTAPYWGVIQLGEDRNYDVNDKNPHHRKKVYEYMGNDTRMCRFNEKQPCNICGKCFGNIEKEDDAD